MNSVDYNSLTDDELIALYNEGDSEAEEFLLKKYIPLVKKEIRYLYIVGAETDDLSQEAMIGLFKAIRDFKPKKGATFITYATTCIRNEIKTAITKSNRIKHQPLNTYISIYANQGTDSFVGNEPTLIIDTLQAGDMSDPEFILLHEELQSELLERIETELSPIERKVTKLYLEGLSHMDIAKLIGKNEQSVTNALSRVRAKLR